MSLIDIKLNTKTKYQIKVSYSTCGLFIVATKSDKYVEIWEISWPHDLIQRTIKLLKLNVIIMSSMEIDIFQFTY